MVGILHPYVSEGPRRCQELSKPIVSITKFEDAYRSVRQALDSCQGLTGLERKDSIRLVDLNEEKFVKVDCDGYELGIGESVLRADKIINVPVLKTHNQTKVSLGIKNLKGVLNRKSKKFCHNKDIDLSYIFPHIIEKLPVALTLIDGVFALAKGPGPTGKAERRNLI